MLVTDLIELLAAYYQFLASLLLLDGVPYPGSWLNTGEAVGIATLNSRFFNAQLPSFVLDVRFFFICVSVVLPLLIVFVGLLALNGANVVAWYFLLLSSLTALVGGGFAALISQTAGLDISFEAAKVLMYTGGGGLLLCLLLFVGATVCCRDPEELHDEAHRKAQEEASQRKREKSRRASMAAEAEADEGSDLDIDPAPSDPARPAPVLAGGITSLAKRRQSVMGAVEGQDAGRRSSLAPGRRKSRTAAVRRATMDASSLRSPRTRSEEPRGAQPHSPDRQRSRSVVLDFGRVNSSTGPTKEPPSPMSTQLSPRGADASPRSRSLSVMVPATTQLRSGPRVTRQSTTVLSDDTSSDASDDTEPYYDAYDLTPEAVMDRETRDCRVVPSIQGLTVGLVLLAVGVLTVSGQSERLFTLDTRNDTWQTVAFALAVAFIAFGVLVLGWTGMGFCVKGRRAQWHIRRFLVEAAMRVLLLAISLAYIPVGQAAVDMFNCNPFTCPVGYRLVQEGTSMPYNTSGTDPYCVPCSVAAGQLAPAHVQADLCSLTSEARLESDPTTACARMAAFFWPAAGTSLLFILLVPVMFLHLMRYTTERLRDEFPVAALATDDDTAIWRRKVDETETVVKFLFQPFRFAVRYTRIALMFQKLVIVVTGKYVFRVGSGGRDVSDSAFISLCCAGGVYLLGGIALGAVRPYQHLFLDVIATLLSALLIVACGLAFGIHYDTDFLPDAAAATVLVLFVVLPLVCFVVGVVMAWRAAKALEERKQDEFRDRVVAHVQAMSERQLKEAVIERHFIEEERERTMNRSVLSGGDGEEAGRTARTKSVTALMAGSMALSQSHSPTTPLKPGTAGSTAGGGTMAGLRQVLSTMAPQRDEPVEAPAAFSATLYGGGRKKGQLLETISSGQSPFRDMGTKTKGALLRWRLGAGLKSGDAAPARRGTGASGDALSPARGSTMGGSTRSRSVSVNPLAGPGAGREGRGRAASTRPSVLRARTGSRDSKEGGRLSRDSRDKAETTPAKPVEERVEASAYASAHRQLEHEAASYATQAQASAVPGRPKIAVPDLGGGRKAPWAFASADPPGPTDRSGPGQLKGGPGGSQDGSAADSATAALRRQVQESRAAKEARDAPPQEEAPRKGSHGSHSSKGAGRHESGPRKHSGGKGDERKGSDTTAEEDAAAAEERIARRRAQLKRQVEAIEAQRKAKPSKSDPGAVFSGGDDDEATSPTNGAPLSPRNGPGNQSPRPMLALPSEQSAEPPAPSPVLPSPTSKGLASPATQPLAVTSPRAGGKEAFMDDGEGDGPFGAGSGSFDEDMDGEHFALLEAAYDAVAAQAAEEQVLLERRQQATDLSVNRRARVLVNRYLMVAGFIGFVALAMSLLGLLSEEGLPVDQTWLAPQTTTGQLAAYPTWAAFAQSCACAPLSFDPPDVAGKAPAVVIVELWRCANGHVVERPRSTIARFDDGTGTTPAAPNRYAQWNSTGRLAVPSGLAMRGVCSTTFAVGCSVTIARNTVDLSVSCNGSVAQQVARSGDGVPGAAATALRLW